MTRFLSFTLAAASLVYFTGCVENDQPPSHQRRPNRYPARPGMDTTQGTQDTAPPSRGGSTSSSSTDVTDTVTPPPPPPPSHTADRPGTAGGGAPQKKDYPYATPVPGKSGFVTSPYAPYSGYVDVRGFPPGTEVKDPYTQKVFLVP